MKGARPRRAVLREVVAAGDGRLPCGQRARGEPLGDDMREPALLVVDPPLDDDEAGAEHEFPVAVACSGLKTTALVMPHSSSRLIKRSPEAVTGRWRQTTIPATRTRIPCGIRFSFRGPPM